ncbi:U3 snoRNP protein [Coemansia sp. RSA 355]|nr:U3 snoRNP protein [Coemansia sp. RSA 371]KAJ2289295.1 U3 snoRNP protein [Coemansia sp. RSA 355]
MDASGQTKRQLRVAGEPSAKRTKDSVQTKTRTETDLELLVFGADEEDASGRLFSKLGREQGSESPASSDNENDEDDEDDDSDDNEDSGEAPLFFVDTERDQQQVESESEAESEDAPSEADEPAAWEDDDMQDATVALKSKARLRKLRTEEDEDSVSGDVYEERLRRQFEKINPVPKWAASDDSDRVGSDLLQTSAPLVSHTHVQLPSSSIDIARVRNANQAAVSQSAVQSVQFHPSASVLLTAGLDKTLRLFEVDGKENQKIQSIYFKDLPITSAQFIRGGHEIVASGRRGWYYAVDVEHATVTRINGVPGRPLKSLEFMRTSTDGDRMAFMGNAGQIHLVSTRTKQFVHTLPMNGVVRDVEFTNDGNYLWSTGLDNHVYQWDLRQNQCVSRWHDPTVFRPTCLAISQDATYYASGDHAGVVNIYDARAMREEAQDSTFFNVRPFKAVSNLTTAVHGLRFNHSAEILAVYSRKKKDQLKLVHLPSATVFSNWPGSNSHLGHVQCVDFSPKSGFMAVGNDAGKALLYRLQHYPTY